MINLTEAILNQQVQYKEKLDEAISIGLSPLEFKKYSGGMGVYPQKKDGAFMVRPRTYSGIVNLKQLVAIHSLAKTYAKEPLHLTTRQSFQFHNVALKDTWNIIETLLPLGIITVGAGGNSIRNISIPPLSGVDPDELFDVTPYAAEATNYALSLDGMNTLPRKYKIAFSGDQRDTAKAKFSDLGFIAVIKDGVQGFAVYGGGGVGSNPRKAVQLESFTEGQNILYSIGAMKRLFEEHGDRTNRNKARIRYILARLGDEAFKRLYTDYLDELKKDKSLQIPSQILEKDTTVSSVSQISSVTTRSSFSDAFAVHKQKTEGLYAVYFHPPKGDLENDVLEKIIRLIEDSNERIEIRLTGTQGFFLRNLTEHDVKYVKSTFDDLIPRTRFDRSLSCTGSKQCKIGRQDSQGMLESLTKHFDKLSYQEKELLPEIRISGCRNACALHPLYPLGFEGSALKTSDGTQPAYKVYIGGVPDSSSADIGYETAILTEAEVIEFVEVLLPLIKNSRYDSYESLAAADIDSIHSLLTGFVERRESDGTK